MTALIVPRTGAEPAAADLIALVKRFKGPARAPRHVEFVDALPMTNVGKIDKKISAGEILGPTTGRVGQHLLVAFLANRSI